MNLFKKKPLITITIIVLIATGISVIFQLLSSDSKTKKLNTALSNSILIKYETSINSKICDITNQHDYVVYAIDKYNSSCYFGLEKKHKETDGLINSFIKKNETIIYKKNNDSIVFFINKDDTLKVLFCIDNSTSALENGSIVN